MKTQMYGRNILRPEIPRLALSASGKASFLRTRLEALWAWGGNPFHPKRIQLAGLAVTLGIVAIMVAMFGQNSHVKLPFQEAHWKETRDWKKIANEAFDFHKRGIASSQKNHFSQALLTYPKFFVNDQFVWKYANTALISMDNQDAKILAVFLDNFGLFLISLQPFKDAHSFGNVDHSIITAEINGLKLKVESMANIYSDSDKVKVFPVVYIKHDPNYQFEQFQNEILEFKSDVRAFNLSSSYETTMPIFSRAQQWGLIHASQVKDLYEVQAKPNVSFKYPKIWKGQESWQHSEIHSASPCDYFRFQDNDQYVFYNDKIGILTFSFLPFEGATQTGEISGRHLTVQTPKGEITIESKKPILNQEKGKIWFRYENPYQGGTPNITTWYRSIMKCNE